MNKVRRYTSPCLLMPSSRGLPPVACCRGTIPNQAVTWRPFLNPLALPRLATKALAVSGPMPQMRLDSAALFVGAVPKHDVSLESAELLIELLELRHQSAQQGTHQPRQAI